MLDPVPSSHSIHHPPSPPSDTLPRSLPLLPRRLRLLFLSLNFDEPPGRELAYDSGSSAKLIRFGVERPDEVALPKARATPTPNRSGMLSVVGEGTGVVDAERFIEECLGGDGGRVEEEWVALV